MSECMVKRWECCLPGWTSTSEHGRAKFNIFGDIRIRNGLANLKEWSIDAPNFARGAFMMTHRPNEMSIGGPPFCVPLPETAWKKICLNSKNNHFPTRTFIFLLALVGRYIYMNLSHNFLLLLGGRYYQKRSIDKCAVPVDSRKFSQGTDPPGS